MPSLDPGRARGVAAAPGHCVAACCRSAPISRPSRPSRAEPAAALRLPPRARRPLPSRPPLPQVVTVVESARGPAPPTVARCREKVSDERVNDREKVRIRMRR